MNVARQLNEILGLMRAVDNTEPNRAARRRMVFGHRRLRSIDSTVGTKPPKALRKSRSRAANKRAQASRKANR